MSAATAQQRLLYVRRNEAAEMRKQIIGLQHELSQSFCRSDCDKIMDLLVAQLLREFPELDPTWMRDPLA